MENGSLCIITVTTLKNLKDTGHSEGLGECVERRPPRDLPGGDVSQHKAKFVQQVPHLRIQRINQNHTENLLCSYTESDTHFHCGTASKGRTQINLI